ncbi:MAG: HAMP domain-containing histidine kinase [Desulfuromonadales bacterium]|nr:HAMP domain-containing histidine kinase [Desulfuromonadales bacterium]
MKETPARHTEGTISEGLVASTSGTNTLPITLCTVNPQKISSEVLKQMAYNDKMAELGRISAGVVHELNAPLSVIVSASQMIMREEGVPEFVRELIERISSEAQRLSQMTRGILNFSSHEEAGDHADVNLTVEFVLDFLAYEASRRGVSLIRSLDHRLPVVRIESNVLKQILINLVMNALQAMEPVGGRLQVESRVLNSSEVCLVISDTGPGIAEESLKRIFEPYFTTKRPGEGTGLGLFVSRTLVENLGGRIEVQSSLGEGTTFTVTLLAEETD